MASLARDLVHRHRFTVDEYHRMGEVGIFSPDARVELIEGEVIDMPPIGSRHADVVTVLGQRLVYAVSDGAQVRDELLGLGVALFAVPKASSLASAAWSGALFGLVVYGVYDLTNYSTLAQWPAIVTVADIVWGTVACALVATVTFYASNR